MSALMQVHSVKFCVPPCPVHGPTSEHPLRDSPLVWRGARRMWERMCPHGIGHPDPDDLAYKRRHMDPEVYTRHAYEIHGCDGCCTEPF